VKNPTKKEQEREKKKEMFIFDHVMTIALLGIFGKKAKFPI